MHRLLRHGLTLLLLGGCVLARAACPFPGASVPATAKDWDDVLYILQDDSCLGDSQFDSDPLTRQVHAALAVRTAAQLPAAALGAMDALVDAASRRQALNTQALAWQKLQQELVATRDRLKSVLALSDASEVSAGLKDWLDNRQWDLPKGPKSAGMEWAGLRFNPIAPLNCASAQPCPEVLSQVDMVRIVKLMGQLQRNTQAPAVAQTLAALRRELGRWEAYRTQAPHQYVWELWLNGQRMDRDPALCPRTGANVVLGFCKVPTNQLIVLHPDVGVRFSRQAGRSSELQPAVIIETLGFASWRWRSDDSPVMEAVKGVSLAAVYAKADSSNWSFGPMFRYNGYNLALTKARGGRVSLTISINLADRYFDRKQTWTDGLKQLDKSSLADLLSR